MGDTINSRFRDIICLNEGGEKFALKFSDPDGVRSGKSGWSFGVCQFDTQNNAMALECLRKCGFSEDEITGIVKQTIDVLPLAARLRVNAEIIEQYDTAQLQHCLNMAANFISDNGIPVDEESGLLAIADYDNQYGSMGAGAVSFLRGLGRPVTAADVLVFKLKGKYGIAHPDDCERRYDNIMKVLAG